MKKSLILLCCLVGLVSCGVQRIIPESVNTINRAQLADLNLERGDYEILNTVTAEASVICTDGAKKRRIASPDGDFSVTWEAPKLRKKRTTWSCTDFKGILRTGALADMPEETVDHADPLKLVRSLALYRAIGLARQEGADAIVEPNYTVSLEQTDRCTLAYKATVTAKVIKLKMDR